MLSENSGVDLGRILPLSSLAGDVYDLTGLQDSMRAFSKYMRILLLSKSVGVKEGSIAWQGPCIVFKVGRLAKSRRSCSL